MKRLCKACGNNLKRIIKIAKTPPCDFYTRKKMLNMKFYSLDLYSCENCKLIQLSDIVDPNKIYKKYLYKTQHSLGLEMHFSKYFKTINSEIMKRKLDKNILDIGCNDGTLLNFFKNKNYKVLGIDPANNILSDCKKKKIPLINKFFTEQLSSNLSRRNKFSLITANNVIANIPNLSEFFKSVYKLLSPKGIFVFETIYGPKIIKNKFIDMINSEHIFYFSIISVKKILDIYGFRMIKVKILESKGGSIRVFAEKKYKDIKILKLKKFKVDFNKEKKLGFHEISKMKKYDKIYKRDQKIISSFLNLLKKNKKIHAYGAAAGSTTIFYQYKLKKIINRIYDDNPLRQGLYLPGSSAKVINPSEIKNLKPNFIVVLAWRYLKQIMVKNRQIKNKSIFVSLLPKLKIYK